MSPIALNVIGSGFQIVGVIFAGFGAWKTWHEFASEAFWQPVMDRAKRVGAAVDRALRGLLRRGPIHRTGTGTLTLNATMTGLGYVGYPPLPSRGTAKSGVAELDRRTRELADRLGRLEGHVDTVVADVRAELNGSTSKTAAHLDKLDQTTHQVAVGGIRIEVLGLLFVAIGLAIQAAATVV